MIVKRININYGGLEYTVSDTDIDDLKTTLLDAATTASPLWLRVNQGEGSYRETELLVAPGIPIAVTAIVSD